MDLINTILILDQMLLDNDIRFIIKYDLIKKI